VALLDLLSDLGSIPNFHWGVLWPELSTASSVVMKMFVEDGLEQNQSQQPEKNNPDYWTKVIASTEQKIPYLIIF